MKKSVSTGRNVYFVLFLLFITVVLAGISTALGPADLSVWDVYFAILHRFFPDHSESRWIAEVVVWNQRLPRIFMGIGAGIALGLAGSMMQWALRNPLADPYTLGISSAAAFGTPLAIISGRGSSGIELFVMGTALVSALMATFIILGVSRRRWATPERVVLVGLMAPYFCRVTTGEDYRFVIPASGLFGAILLIGAEIVARMVIVPAGVVTTLMGAPLFIYLLIKMTTKKVAAGDW